MGCTKTVGTIDLTNIPHLKDHRYDWKNAIGVKCDFTFQGHSGTVIITKYDLNKSKVYVNYNNNEYSFDSTNFKNGALGKLFNIRSKEFLYNIGDVLHLKKQDLLIIDREKRKARNANLRWYKYKCCDCNYEGWIEENHIKEGRGCKRCNDLTYIEVGYNDITTTDPWMIPYFLGGVEEAQKYHKNSKKHIIFKCPSCGKVATRPISINNLYLTHSIACPCNSTSKSIPEIIMSHLLELFNIQYRTQLSCTTFKWIGRYLYDFYIPELNCIIETHGDLHYHEHLWSEQRRTLEEELANDKRKRELALANGIEHYYEVNCSNAKAKNVIQHCEECGLLLFLNINKDNINYTDLMRRESDVDIVNELQEYLNGHPDAKRKEICDYFGWTTYFYYKYMNQLEELPILYTQNRTKARKEECTWN